MPLRRAGRLAEQLREALLGRAALGDVVAVLAIGPDDVVRRPQGGDGADAHALLSDAEVQKAADFALRVRFGRRLFHAADGQHLPIELGQKLPLRGVRLLVPLSIHGRNIATKWGGVEEGGGRTAS